MKAGQVGPEGVEMTRYLHPNCEWKTLMGGITYRGFFGMAGGFDQLVEAAQACAIKLKEVTDLGGPMSTFGHPAPALVRGRA